MIQTLTAINLKTIPYSESSLIIHVFSKEKGKLSLIAKGVKKSKTGNLGKLSTFSLNKYHVRGKDEESIKTIMVIETIKTYEKIQLDYDKLQTAYGLIWIINSIIQENHQAEELFILLENALDELELANNNNISLILSNFKKDLLFHEGVLNPNKKNINIELTLKNYIGKQMVQL
ncbi:MAG: DNA repair protein RecO [Candidatus Riflemargulisbacteria bacterium]